MTPPERPRTTAPLKIAPALAGLALLLHGDTGEEPAAAVNDDSAAPPQPARLVLPPAQTPRFAPDGPAAAGVVARVRLESAPEAPAAPQPRPALLASAGIASIAAALAAPQEPPAPAPESAPPPAEGEAAPLPDAVEVAEAQAEPAPDLPPIDQPEVEPPPAANDNAAVPAPAFAAPTTVEPVAEPPQPEPPPPRLAVVEPVLAPVASSAPSSVASPPQPAPEPSAPAPPAPEAEAPPPAPGPPAPAFAAAPATPLKLQPAVERRFPMADGFPDAGPEPLPEPVPPAASPPELVPLPTLPAPGFGAAPAPAVPVAEPPAPLASHGPPRLGPPQIGYDSELLLELRTARGEVADTITAYADGDAIYLPLGALARFLDLAIRVSNDGRFASGWFLDEARTLSIDLAERRLVVEGRELPLAEGDAIAFDGELYLRAERFADLFPLTLTPNLRDQSVEVRTLAPFPFEERLAREAQRTRLANGGGAARTERWPRQETPWKALDAPMADVELRATSDSQLGARLEGDLRVAGDLAWMTAQAFLGATTRDGVVAARVALGRQDPDAGLLGPLRATEFQVGDVATLAMPLGLRGTSGRGFSVTNTPIERTSVFDRVDLRGELPAGWEVELYRNGVLVGSTAQAVNGQYEFLQVPVDYGLNLMRLVFYGPQGQRREDVRRITVDDGRLSPGQFVYGFGMAQKDVNLFDARGPNFTRTQDFGAWRASATLAYGVSPGLTAHAGAAWFESDRGRNWQANAGLRTSLGGFAVRADVAAQARGARAWSLGLGGKLAGISFIAGHTEYAGPFVDEVRAFSSDPLRRVSELDLNATLSLGGQSLPLSARLRRVKRLDGRTQTDAALRTSVRLGGLLASNTLQYAHARIAGGSGGSGSGGGGQLTGSFDLATLSGSRTQVRAGLGYGLAPRLELISAAAEVTHRLDDDTSVGANVSHVFARPGSGGETRFGLTAVRRMGAFTLGFDGSVSTRSGDHAAMLRLGFAFGRNPLTGRVFTAPQGLATGGAVAVRAFRDADGDGRFSPGEEPLPEVTFATGNETAQTDAQGQVLLGRAGSGNRASVRIDADSLPDIALAPATRGIEFVPRPGRVHVADFAVQELSELEGTARLDRGGKMTAVAGLEIELVDAAGKVAARARSEADGFFLLEQVRPGAYVLRLEPGQAARLGLRLPEQPVLVGGKATVMRRDLEVASE